MKFQVLFTFLVVLFAHPGHFVLTAADDEVPEKAATVKLVSFTACFVFGLAEEDVVRSCRREITIKRPSSDPMTIRRREIKSERYQINDDWHGDMRAVFCCDGQTFAFDANGSLGMVEGESVTFSKEVTEWFQQNIRPLAGPGTSKKESK